MESDHPRERMGSTSEIENLPSAKSCQKPDRQGGRFAKCTCRGFARIGANLKKNTNFLIRDDPRQSAANLCCDLPSLTVGLLTPISCRARSAQLPATGAIAASRSCQIMVPAREL